MRSFWTRKAIVPPVMNSEDWPWIWALRDGSVLDWKRGLTDGEIQAQALRQQRLPVEILPGKLFLGNAQSIHNVKGLKELGITAVLNMAGPVALRKEHQKALTDHGIVYLQLEAEDDPTFPILEKHWQEAYNFLNANASGTTETLSKKCVVHCVAGINRSAFIVCAYYMLATQTPILETVQYVRHQRGNVALGNEGFQEQLVALARQHNLLGNPPGSKGSIVPESPPTMAEYMAKTKSQKKVNPLDRLVF